MMENLKEPAAFLFAICLLLLVSCAGDRLYYANKQNPVDDIRKSFGEPVSVESLADGSEKIMYLVHDPMGSGYSVRYFIIRDGKVVGGGVR
jgi:hypothetical protein